MSFIVYEGADGVGKTFTCKKLSKKNKWFYLKTPPFKKKCKNPKEELDNYIVGLLLNSFTIREKLAQGKTVICDRYYSTYLVDCALLGEKPLPWLKEYLPVPDKEVLLTAPWEVVVKRLKRKRKRSDLENEIIKDEKVYRKVEKKFRKVLD